jgi:hypothetical protein
MELGMSQINYLMRIRDSMETINYIRGYTGTLYKIQYSAYLISP